MISQLPKGALPDPPDHRDYLAAPHMASLPPVDWSKGSGLPRPPLHDQDTSDACVAHSWSYYHYQLKGKEYSRRDVFARIAQSYGAVIRDGGVVIVKQGQQTQDELPDPNPETPINMRDKTGIDPDKELDDQEANSFVVGASIDSTAQAILAYKGVVFGVTGSNEGWTDLTNPRPPEAGEETWGHALYAVDFHLHDGQKCIIAVTSWPKAGITEHHIKEDYFKSGNTFVAWTLIPKEQQIMPKKFIINDNGKLGLLIVEGFTGNAVFADTMEHFTELKDAFGYTGNEPTINLPQ